MSMHAEDIRMNIIDTPTKNPVTVHGFRGSPHWAGSSTGFTENLSAVTPAQAGLNSLFVSSERSCTEVQSEVYLVLDQA